MSNENFVFREQLSDLATSDFKEPSRDLENELFGKKGLKAGLDALEHELGYATKAPVSKTKVYNKIFTPAAEDDQALLNELLNDPKFQIVKWVDSWTAHGDYRVFVIYTENIDLRKNKSKEDTDDESN